MNYRPFVRKDWSYETDWPFNLNHDYAPNARQAVVVEATEKAMDKMKNSLNFNGCYYVSELNKLVMEILGVPDGHDYTKPSDGYNVENGALGHDVYRAQKLIENRRYHERQTAIMRGMFICKGQRVGDYKEPFGKLRRNIVINEIFETGVQIHFTQGNRRYQQTVPVSMLELMLGANRKDDPPVSFDESPLEALINDL